jgi:DNA-binding response OmpR family regulator
MDTLEEPSEIQEPPTFGELGKRERPLILIADDSAEIRKLLGTYFADQDCDLIESVDGADALEQVIIYKPDLVILDVMMPELNGWQICKYVKSREEYQGIGVIMLTAIGPVNNELTSPLFGADDYIDKPFEFSELSFKIKKVLSAKRGTA